MSLTDVLDVFVRQGAIIPSTHTYFCPPVVTAGFPYHTRGTDGDTFFLSAPRDVFQRFLDFS